MSEVTLTVKKIVEMGLWSKVCEYKGWKTIKSDSFNSDRMITFNLNSCNKVK